MYPCYVDTCRSKQLDWTGNWKQLDHMDCRAKLRISHWKQFNHMDCRVKPIITALETINGVHLNATKMVEKVDLKRTMGLSNWRARVTELGYSPGPRLTFSAYASTIRYSAVICLKAQVIHISFRK